MSTELQNHLSDLRNCARCPKMHKPVVVGRPVVSKILLVGQAPGIKEPQLERPFAWTAGKTLFKWLEAATGWDEDAARNQIYFAAVCRCFPGKNPKGGDRVPDSDEIQACSHWLKQEIGILKPKLVLPVGKLAIAQFLEFNTLNEVIGQQWIISPNEKRAQKTDSKSWNAKNRTPSALRPLPTAFDLIPLPHPSGASTWHRTEPGRTLLQTALQLISQHPTVLRASK